MLLVAFAVEFIYFRKRTLQVSGLEKQNNRCIVQGNAEYYSMDEETGHESFTEKTC